MRSIGPLLGDFFVETDAEARLVGRQGEAGFVGRLTAFKQVGPEGVFAAVADLLDGEAGR